MLSNYKQGRVAVKLSNGDAAEIYSITYSHDVEVINGRRVDSQGNKHPVRWYRDGSYSQAEDSQFDVVEVIGSN